MRRESENLGFSFLDEEGISYSLIYSLTKGSWDLYTNDPNDEPLTADIEQQKELIENWLEKRN